MWLLVFLARILATALGACLVYISVFTYENEQGQLQSRIEYVWVRIDDLRKAALGRSAAFLRAVAELTQLALDRLFGARLWSLRAISTSGLLSLSSFCVSQFVSRIVLAYAFVELTRRPDVSNLAEEIWLTKATVVVAMIMVILKAFTFPHLLMTLFGLGSLALVVAVMPSWKERFAPIGVWLFGILLVLLACTALMPKNIRPHLLNRAIGNPEILGASLLFGIVMDIAFLALVRWLLRMQATGTSLWRIALSALAQIIAATVLVIGPVALFLLASALVGGPVQFAFLLSILTNLYSVLVAIAFLIVAIAAFLHRGFWPLLERPIYAIQRAHLFQSPAGRAAMFAAGSALITVVWSRAERVLAILKTIL